MLKRIVIVLVAAIGLVLGSFSLAIAMPEPFFSHQLEVGRYKILTDRPIDAEQAKHVLATVEARLSKSPLNTPSANYNIVVPGGGLKRLFFFAPARKAGGVAYFPLSTNSIFLSDVDFKANQLIAASGCRPENKRTLAYFITHEITHLQTGAAMTPLSYLRLPVWVREGLADRIGLGVPDDTQALKEALKTHAQWGRNEWNRFGYYAHYRHAVNQMLDDKQMSITDLLSLRTPFDAQRGAPASTTQG
jgi:hypothetical protein